jgi:hypothetical protein
VVKGWSLGIFYRPSRHRVTIVAIIDLRRDPLPLPAGLGYMKGLPISSQVRPWHFRQAYPLVPTFG